MTEDAQCAVSVSPGCQNDCVFCRRERRLASPKELKRQEAAAMLNLEEFRKKGLASLEIFGSDPSEYSGIFGLVRHAKKMGFEKVMLSTHGRRLSERDFAEELAGSGVDVLKIPLYGADAKTHDSITGTGGSFEETVKGIRLIRSAAPSIKVEVHCLILRENCGNLDEVAMLAGELKADSLWFGIPELSAEDCRGYVPIKELVLPARALRDFCNKKGIKAEYRDITFCVFGEYEKEMGREMRNDNYLPELGSHNRPVEMKKEKIPFYRLKKQTEMCAGCRCRESCAGFFARDIERFGTGSLEPILSR